MSESFLSKEDDVRLEFLLRLHQAGKVSLTADNSIDGVAQHIHWILFPNGIMSYAQTRRAINFPDALIERLQKAGIGIKFCVGFNPVTDPGFDVVYSDGEGTTVSYRLPLAFKHQ